MHHQKLCDPIVLVYSYICIVGLNSVISIKIGDTELIILKKIWTDKSLDLSSWLWNPIFSGHGFFFIRALIFDEILVHKNSKKSLSLYFIFAKQK